MSDDMHRTIGRHSAEIEALQVDMQEIKRDVKALLAIMHQAQGSWRAMVAMSSLAATIGGFVGWVLHMIWPSK